MLVYCETRPTKGILVVNQTSADPGIKGVIPVPMDFDHISICKVADRKSQIYRQVKRFIQDNLVKSLVSTEPNHYPRKNLLPILEPPKNLGCTPKWLWIKFSLPRFITNLSVEFKIILAWCLLCNYFNEKVFREILLITKQDTNFNHRVIWHWIIGLEITQKSTVAEGFYRIKITYKNQNKLLKPFNTKDIHVELVNVFEKCLNTEIDPQYSDLYKAEKIIHQIDGDVYDIPSESIENILSVFRYKPEVVKGVLNSISRLSKRLNNPEIYKNHKIALFIPARGNIDSILIFPAAILLEKSLSRLRHRKFAVFPLYILALVYQTWSSHDKAIETLEKAINLFPDKKPKLVGVLSSRLALSYIMKGQMSQAKECLRDADRVLEYESTEWFDNRLNNQIWLLKRGNWNQALTNSSELEKCIKDPYLKAKQAHILGVNHLYMGNLEKAKEYAYKCEELSSMVTLSSWIIGKAWRNRFAYELLSTIELVEGNFEEAERISKDITRQLTPLFRWILGYTVKNHLLYTRAYISAMIGDLSGAEHQQHQLLQDNHLEAYYCVTSKLNLAEIYSKKDQKVEAAKLYNEMEEEAKRIGFKYLEFRAYKKRNEIYQNQSLDINNERDEYDFKKNSNSYMDGLEFLIPV
jgi:tetratricopeptide (TPR) repeat protein